MKKVKKIISLAIGVAMTASVLVGCSANGQELYNSFSKQKSMKSVEMKSDFSLKVSGKNLSSEEEKALATLPLKDGVKVSTKSKSIVNEDKTIAKTQNEISVGISDMSMNMNVWTDMNVSGDKPQMKSVMTVPFILKNKLPQLNGKEYMVMDYAEMNSATNIPGQPPVDYKQIMELSKNIQPKLAELMKVYLQQYSFSKDIVTKSDKQNLVVGGVQQEVTIYEVKLNDSTFKELLKYTVANLGENKDIIEKFIKECMPSAGLIDLNKLPEATKSLASALDSIKDIKILGDNGLVLKYAINKDGDIINQKGTMDIVFDTANIKKLAKGGQAPNFTGVYTITLDFNMDIYNINGDVKIEMPTLTSANSINMIDLNKPSTNENTTNKDESNLSQLDIAYKTAFNNVKVATTLATVNGVKPTYFKVEGSLDVGISPVENVVKAANGGLQSIINEGRKSINNLPDSLLQQKRTLSSILDNYQHPIYEVTVNLINNNKINPKQNEIILGRQLIKDIPAEYKTSYSSALDEVQQGLLSKTFNLVNKATESKKTEDIESAKAAINELKTIPTNFAGESVLKFISDLEGKLK